MSLVVVVLPDAFPGMGGPNSRAMPQGLDQKSKMEVVPKRHTDEAQMRDNPGGGE